MYIKVSIDIFVINGAIAQLVEHLHGMQGVSGSNPLGSIIILEKLRFRCFEDIGSLIQLHHFTCFKIGYFT